MLLARPFKVIKIGPVRLFIEDMEKALEFYTRAFGFAYLLKKSIYEGHRCVFLRCNTEHHSMALYPIALREELGLSPHTTCMSFGNQVGGYGQFARCESAIWKSNGVAIKYLATGAFPGHGLQRICSRSRRSLWCSCITIWRQVGWDGPRPHVRSSAHRQSITRAGRDAVPALSDTYDGETLLGPLG